MLAAVFALAWSAAAQASPTKRFDRTTQTCRILTFHNSGWVSRGAKLFKQNCKVCHHRGNDKGAKFLHSGSKSMKGWNRLFYKRYVRCAREGYWDRIAQEDLAEINDYLYRNASNSYDPNDAEDCG
jgi:mono/diheme cytochrome c family protein